MASPTSQRPLRAARPAIVIGQGADGSPWGQSQTLARPSPKGKIIREGLERLECSARPPPAPAPWISASCRAKAARRLARWSPRGALDVLFLLADEIELSASDAFTIYLGTHGDRGPPADVILPGPPIPKRPVFT